jgi:hypothetical protein
MNKATAREPASAEIVTIRPANIVSITVRVSGRAPYLQAAFSEKARHTMTEKMIQPKNERRGKSARPPRNFDEDFEQAQHKAVGGWSGIPASAFRTAMIDACRTVDLPMTRAKMSVFVVADGFDVRDGQPLIRLQSAQGPERTEMAVRNDTGVADIRVRPMWREWWADVTIEFDADMITAESVVNLLDRAGKQVGIGEGRPFSKKSCGMGWGTFTVVVRQSAEVSKSVTQEVSA